LLHCMSPLLTQSRHRLFQLTAAPWCHASSIAESIVDNLGDVLLRINDRDYYERISLLNLSSGNYRRFFAVERTFYLSVHS
jgi:hypothetical protein